MATGPQAFYCLWQTEAIRENLFDRLSKDDVCNVRLANSACCNLVTKRLFLRTNLTFTANTFTKQSRVQALARIGHHIEHLTFYFPHSDATFLPPLVHPETGREISFLYTPHTSMASVLARPKFANTGLGEILTEQYPPLFHAASNVPSFINAMKHVPNVRHLTIKTPGQNANERYRRDIVDYALISLRISLERAPLTKLTKLSLSSVHPSAIIYLRHVPGFGCTPSAGRRWRQIRKLSMSVEAWDFYGPSPGLDHLKMMDDFIRTFADGLEKLTFTWLGRKGPCPVALAADPLFAPPRSTQKLFNEVTSPMSPLPPVPSRRPVVFSSLRYMSIRNATMNAPQVADLVSRNQHCVREFDFDNVVLINNGSWDEALGPLMDNSGRSTKSEHWSRRSTGSVAEIGAVSLMPPIEIREDWDAESAAVAAASQELLEIDLNGGDAGDDGFADTFGYEEEGQEDEMPELDSDLEAARQASLNFTARIKKRRITKRRRRRKESHDREARDEPEAAPRHRLQKSQDGSAQPPQAHKGQPSQQSLRRQYSDLEPSTPPRAPPQPQHYRSRSQLFGEMDSIRSQSSQRLFGEVASIRSQASSQLLFGEVTPAPGLSHSPYDSPVEDGQSLYEDYFPPPTPATRTSSNYEQRSPPMTVSSPIMDTKPSMPVLLQPSVYDPTADLCGEISAVQRDIEAEEAQRMLAENTTLQSSALKKAKEAVLTKMSERFHGSSSKRPAGPKRESMLPAMNMSMRLREGLFKSRGHKDNHGNNNNNNASNHTLDHQSMDVPILFSPR